MGKIKGFFKGLNSRLKRLPGGRQGKAFVRVLQFFAIMIVLTIFARGVAGVTMPEVTLTGLSQQTISVNDQFSGTVTASSKTDIAPPPGLKVAAVHVNIGEFVQIGADLVSFDTVALDEQLLNARNTLLGLQQQLQALQESDGPDNSAITMAEELRDDAKKRVDTMTSACNLAQSTKDDAAAAVTAAEQNLKAVSDPAQQQIDYNNALAAINKDLTDAQNAEDGAKTTYEVALGAIKTLTDDPSWTEFDPDYVLAVQEAERLQGIWLQAQAENTRLKAEYVDPDTAAKAQVQAAVSNAEAAVADARNAAALAQADWETANDNLDDANEALASAQKTLDEAIEDFNKAENNAALTEQIRQNNIRLKRLEIDDQQKVVDDVLVLQSAGGTLKATEEGTVSDLTMVSGATTGEADYVQISTGSMGLMVEFVVTQAQMRNIKIGDAIMVQRDGYYYSTEARVASRGLADENGYITVRAQLQSYDFDDGDRVSINIQISSGSYWYCVPVSAIRPDAGESYVLVLYERSTVLGMQTIAVKTPVTVLEQNSEYAAIDGLYDSQARIVLSSSKPVNDGDMVRVSEESSR